MAKRRARIQIGNLTLDHKKSRIDLIPLCVGGIRQPIGKLLARATILLWTSFQSEACMQSYEAQKLQESQL
jgi:hypothetical protein